MSNVLSYVRNSQRSLLRFLYFRQIHGYQLTLQKKIHSPPPFFLVLSLAGDSDNGKMIFDFYSVNCLARWIVGRIEKVGKDVVKPLIITDNQGRRVWSFFFFGSPNFSNLVSPLTTMKVPRPTSISTLLIESSPPLQLPPSLHHPLRMTFNLILFIIHNR